MKAPCLKLALLGVSFTIAFGLGEAMVRVTAPQQIIRPLTGVYRRDEDYGWRHQENLDQVVNTGERNARVESQ